MLSRGPCAGPGGSACVPPLGQGMLVGTGCSRVQPIAPLPATALDATWAPAAAAVSAGLCWHTGSHARSSSVQPAPAWVGVPCARAVPPQTVGAWPRCCPQHPLLLLGLHPLCSQPGGLPVPVCSHHTCHAPVACQRGRAASPGLCVHPWVTCQGAGSCQSVAGGSRAATSLGRHGLLWAAGQRREEVPSLPCLCSPRWAQGPPTQGSAPPGKPWPWAACAASCKTHLGQHLPGRDGQGRWHGQDRRILRAATAPGKQRARWSWAACARCAQLCSVPVAIAMGLAALSQQQLPSA